MTPQVPYVSVVDPIGPAIERVKMILFRPFSLERWLVIGFCAWLAQLGEAGGGGGGGGGRTHYQPGQTDQVRNSAYQAKEFVLNNLHWIIPVAIIVVALIIGLWLLITWLNSRGRFMFLYCVAQNKAEVRNPWHLFRDHGDSLFAFRIAVGIIGSIVMSAIAVAGGLLIYYSVTKSGFNALSIFGIVAFSLLLLAAIVLLIVIGKFTKDFVVPIMYLHTPSAVQGWRVLLDILSFNKGRFILYLLFHILISFAVGAMVVAVMCLTCCCAACVFALPYIGTVALLPVSTFMRSYSLYYLAQYGPQLNAIAPMPEMIPPAAPPLA